MLLTEFFTTATEKKMLRLRSEWPQQTHKFEGLVTWEWHYLTGLGGVAFLKCVTEGPVVLSAAFGSGLELLAIMSAYNASMFSTMRIMDKNLKL